MIKKILYTLTVLFLSVSLFGQNISYLGGTSASFSGLNQAKTLNYTVPAGTNRLIMVTFYFERQHSSGGNNHITSTYAGGAQDFNFLIGGKSAHFVGSGYSMSCKACTTVTLSNTTLSNITQVYYLTEADITAGNILFDWSSVRTTNQNAGDETSIQIAVFNNVSPLAVPKFVAYKNVKPQDSGINTITASTSEYVPTPTPVGRNAVDLLYFSGGAFSKTESIGITNNVTTWTKINSFEKANSGGNISNISSLASNELDGIAVRYDYATNQTSIPPYSIRRGDTNRVNDFTAFTLQLNPLAKPGVTGYVYLDTNGPNTIYGPGTGKAAKYVNIVGTDGKVVATALVGDDGKYTIPAGILLEGLSYSVQLTKNPGVVGATAPTVELEKNWVYVGESAGQSTGNDGTTDGKINIIAQNTNFVNYNFGVNNLNDNDGDGIPDNLDLDDDNDGIPDCEERGITGDLNSYFTTKGTSTKIITGGYMILTEDLANQTAQAWSTKKVDFARSFNINFRAYLGDNTNGADGIAIVFQNDKKGSDAVGYDGDGIGARGIENGIVLEIDSYSNTTAPANDPASNNTHGQIWNSHDQSKITDPIDLGINMRNNSWYPVSINWDASTKTLSYTVNGVNAGTAVIPDIKAKFGNENLVNFGFTASTGQSTNRQQLRFDNPCAQLPYFVDSDGDGISDDFDLDSDNDGCPDAVEGDENVTLAHLNPDGSINYLAFGDVGRNNTLNTYGIPNIVNNGGIADIGNDAGQGIGTSNDRNISSCNTKIEITKDNGQTKYARPSVSTYTITVKNTGDSRVANINLTDALPATFGTADMTYTATASVGSSVRKLIADTPGTTVSGTGAIDNYINLPIGGQVVYTVKLNISAQKRGSITNTANITLPSDNTNNGNNSASDTDTPGIDARNDNFANSAVNNTKGGIVGNVTTNDLLDDLSQASKDPTTFNTLFTYTLNNDGGIGATIDNNGNVIIPNGTPVGIYTLTYTICEKGATPANCDTATIIVEVFDDSDGDGISDVIDLDDDNDGILDTVEATACGSPTEYFIENFGTGSRMDFPTYKNTITTTYRYEPGPYNSNSVLSGIDDGEYALLANLDNVAAWALNPPGTNGNAWVTTNDHTSNDGIGRMAVFNAYNSYSENFMTIANIGGTGGGTALPTNTTLKITFWAKNLDKTNMSNTWDKNRSLPSIRVSLSSGGIQLKEFTTGTIPRDEQWHQYTAYFHTENGTTVDLSMFNDMEGGLGNDLAIDDIKIRSICDTDGDGIPNELDLDSDKDGCTDAVEGAGNYFDNQLVTASGILNTQSPNKNFGIDVDANGIPTAVGPAGQGAGNAYNLAINDCKCFKSPNTTGTALETNVGVSGIGTTTGWPQNRKGAMIALESQNKGLVVSRLTTTQINAITKPQEGMMVYDTTANCIKIYSKDTGVATFSWKCFNVQSCPDN